MRFIDTEEVQQSDSIVGHIVEGVRRLWTLPRLKRRHERGNVGSAEVRELGTEARVPVVKPDHVMFGIDQLPTKLFVPLDHLCPDAHDQQKRVVIRRAECVVFELDTVRLCLGHGFSDERRR